MTGRSVDLDGATGFIEKVGAEIWGETNFTIGLRVRPHAVQSKTIFSLAAAGLSGVSEYFRIRTQPSSGRMTLVVETLDQAGAVAVSFQSSLRINANEWTHIAYKDANGAGQFYLNGVKDLFGTTYTRPTLAAMNRTMIGSTIISGAVTSYFDGDIDAGSFRVYDTALSDADAAKLPKDFPGPIFTGTVVTNENHRMPFLPIEVGANFSVLAQRDAHVTIDWNVKATLMKVKRLPLLPLIPTAFFNVIASKEAIIMGLSLPITANFSVVTTRIRKVVLDPLLVTANFSVLTGKSTKIPLEILQVNAAFNVVAVGGKLRTPTDQQFRYEVRDSAGVLKGFLEGVHRARHREKINEPSRLTFRVPATAEGADLIDRTKEVWVVDMRDGSILDRTQIDDYINVNEPSGVPSIEVECYGILNRLGEQFVTGYSATAKAYRDVIKDLLAFQTDASPIVLAGESSGFPSTTWTGEFGYTSILDALGQIRNATGGFFRITPGTRRLVWTSSIIPDRSNTRFILEGVNVNSLDRQVDNSGIVTRLYATGAGEGTAEITLLDAGHPTKYMDADTIGTHGVIERRIKFVEITDPAVLLEAATQYLEAHKNPVERISVRIAENIEE